MARTAVQRSITFDPSSRLTDFLGVGYSTTGVAVASLTSLSPIYPSRTILQLSRLKREVSARTQRAGDPDVATDELAFMVHCTMRWDLGGPPMHHPTYAVCVYTHTGLFVSLRA
jgi:hypothetical protein